MATGLVISTFYAQSLIGPSATPAGRASRAGLHVITFADAVAQSARFAARVPEDYSGGAWLISSGFSMESATSGSVVWFLEIDKIDNADTESYAAIQSFTVAAPAVSGRIGSAIWLLSGAALDGLAAGDWFRMRLTRDGGNGSDTATGAAEMHFLIALEN